MTTRDYTANVISATKVVPDGNFKTSAASGVWDINEALDLIKGGNWPNAANIDPATFVDGLFQTHVYNGTGAEQTITNDINLSGKGGLVWIKLRTTTTGFTFDNHLFDTERGALKRIRSNRTNAESTYSNSLTSFNSNGFTLGSDSSSGNVNYGSGTNTYVSWTFRKQPKFFDVVAYDGTGSARTISHNLGSVPGMIMIKHRNGSSDWHVYHRSTDSSAPEDYILHTNTNDARSDETIFNDTAPTSSVFSVSDDIKVNGSGGNTYVAYLFAHNNNDGGFGEPGDQDIIKCDTFTNSGSTVSVNLGFEPQFIMFKNASSTGSWFVVDSMRGIFDGSTDRYLTWDGNGAEANLNAYTLTPTGFDIDGSVLGNGDYIYMAIRRGGMQTPTAASDVFSIDTKGSSAPYFDSNHIVDMALVKSAGATGDWYNYARLMGEKYLKTNADSAEAAASEAGFDFMDGHIDSDWGGTDAHSWMWKRARGYFDVVTYTGNNTLRTINHNLGVVPEMMWLKRRNSADIWTVYHSAIGEGKRLKLHQDTAAEDDTNSFNNTAPTSTVFTINQNVNQLNASGSSYIAYLFATVAGVSKVGSFTYAGASGATNVDCGFTSGSKFVIFKRTDSTGDWYVVDTTRGITSGNDPYLRLNTTNAEATSTELINQLDAGFTVQQYQGVADGTYIFYAIAA